jgi:hypothetical protein
VTPERFRELIEVYGGDPRRWPASERAAALAYRRDHADDVQAVLAEASELDGIMDRFAVMPPDAALRERIVASGPTPGSDRGRAGLWWQSAGVAGVGLAGAVVGALIISTVASVNLSGDDDDVGYVATAFEDFSFPSEP